MASLKHDLLNGLSNSTGAQRTTWTTYIIEYDISLLELMDILFEEPKTASRFSWIIGGMCEHFPQKVAPIIVPVFKNKDRVHIPNFHRSIAKMFHLVGVPEEIEGEALNAMVDWLLDPKIIVSTKNHSLFALYNLSEKYIDLKIELEEIIIDQLDKNSKDFKKRANKILEKLQVEK